MGRAPCPVPSLMAPLSGDNLLEQAYVVACYGFSERRQTALLAQQKAWQENLFGTSTAYQWELFEHLLLEECRIFKADTVEPVLLLLSLLVEQQQILKYTSQSLGFLDKAIHSLLRTTGVEMRQFSVFEWMLQLFTSAQWSEPLTYSSILKKKGYPSVIPQLDKIFAPYLFLIDTLRRVTLSSPSQSDGDIDVDSFNPVIGNLIVQRLLDSSPSLPNVIPQIVQDQCQLYLDMTRPFLLFRPDFEIEGNAHCVDMSLPHRWARKLTTRLIAWAALNLGAYNALAELPTTLPTLKVSMEIKDARKKYNFEPFEWPNPAFKTWTHLAQGVATALTTFPMKPFRKSVEPFWVFNQLPKGEVFDSQSAGLLLGLGLAGHLVAFKSMDIFEILAHRHEETSAALLFGLGASRRGRPETSLTQLIGVHIKGFQQPSVNPKDLVLQDVPLQVQTAAIAALGFLHMGTGDQRITAVATREMMRSGPAASKSKVMFNPAHAAAAGLAFGLINLGQGKDLESSILSDHQIDTLVGMLNESNVSGEENPDANVPAATLGLLGIFAASDELDLGQRIDLPHLEALKQPFNGPKPVHLFMRVLTRMLITGKSPYSLEDCIRVGLKSTPTENQSYIYYIIGAIFFGTGIVNAGTHDRAMFEPLGLLLERFLESVWWKRRPLGSDFIINYFEASEQFAVDMLILAKALIMSGSGDVDLFKENLRPNFLDHINFASNRSFLHHLALGVLIAGGGKLKVSTNGGKDPLAVLALVCPVLAALHEPMLEDDHFIPRPFQFLWSLALVPNGRDPLSIQPDLSVTADLLLEDCEESVPDDAEVLYHTSQLSYGKVYDDLTVESARLLKTFATSFLPRISPTHPLSDIEILAIERHLKSRL